MAALFFVIMLIAAEAYLFHSLFRYFWAKHGWSWHRVLRRETGEVYMDRYQILKTRPLSIYINHIRLPDADPLVHNHPWPRAYSVKLKGRYTEDVAVRMSTSDGSVVLVPVANRPGLISRIPQYHRITEVPPGGCWTLFVGFNSRDKWGFLDTDGTLIPWRERLAQRGIDADAQERRR